MSPKWCPRDASWSANPDVTAIKKLHISIKGLPYCGQNVILNTNHRGEVVESMKCKRCLRKWQRWCDEYERSPGELR